MADNTWIKETDEGEGILRLTLNQPPVNSLTAEMLMGLDALLADVETRADVRAIVIDSALKVLSAGLNLKAAQAYDDAAQRAVVEGLNRGFLRLFACPKPVVVAAAGAAIAGGLFFVLAADHRVAGPAATFGLAEVRVGVDFPAGPMEIARAMLAPNDLRRLMMRGRPIGVEEAQAAGLVDRIVPQDQVLAMALRDAADLAQIPPAAYAAVKRQIRGETVARIEQAMTEERPRWFNNETRAAMARMLG